MKQKLKAFYDEIHDRQKLIGGFKTKYNISKTVYYEVTGDITSAISREKQTKGWLRSKRPAPDPFHSQRSGQAVPTCPDIRGESGFKVTPINRGTWGYLLLSHCIMD